MSIMKRVISWLKQLANQRDYEVDASEAFIKYYEHSTRGIVAIKNLEHLLDLLTRKRKRMAFFIPDWGDYERQQFNAFYSRLKGKNEQENKDTETK